MGSIKLYGIIAGAAAILGLIAAVVFFKLERDVAEAQLETAKQNLAVAKKAAEDNAFALAVLQAQQQGGEAVAEQVFRRLADVQAFAKVQQQRIANAPVTERNNSVVPGVVADYYDELRNRRAAGAGPQAGGPAASAGSAEGGLPAGAPAAAPQRVPGQRRAPAHRGAGGADRPRRPVPDRGRRLEGVGRLHADPAVRSQGGVPGARRGAGPAAARGLIAAAVVAVMAAQIDGRALAQSGAHGDGHAQQHDIYKDWRHPMTRASCCNAQTAEGQGDCRPTRAYFGDDGLWRAWGGHRWLTVPRDRLLPADFAGDGRNHLCELHGDVFCFTPAPPKS